MISILFLGVAAGVSHVLTGPDHFAVLAPFSVEARRSAWTVGLRWGVGHAAGIVAVALGVVFAADRLDLKLLDAAGDYLVGAVLVAVGLWGLYHGRRTDRALEGALVAQHRHVHATAALSIGTLHGLVGTGATLAVLPAVGMRSVAESITYLAGFSAGTIASMSALAGLLGALAPRDDLGTAYRRMYAFASSASLALGAVWLALALAGVDVHAG
ncbi:MAG: hypothetical protein ACHQ6T_18565 [Myxococcota bacterium]